MKRDTPAIENKEDDKMSTTIINQKKTITLCAIVLVALFALCFFNLKREMDTLPAGIQAQRSGALAAAEFVEEFRETRNPVRLDRLALSREKAHIRALVEHYQETGSVSGYELISGWKLVCLRNGRQTDCLRGTPAWMAQVRLFRYETGVSERAFVYEYWRGHNQNRSHKKAIGWHSYGGGWRYVAMNRNRETITKNFDW